MAKKPDPPIDPAAYERSLKRVAEAQARYLEAAAKVKVPGAAFYDGYDGGSHAVSQDGKTKTVTPQTNGAIGKGDRVMVAGGQMTAMPHKSPPPKQPPGKTDKRGKIKFLFCSRELFQEKMYTTFWVAGWRENRRDFAFRVPLEAPDKAPGMTSRTEIVGAIVNNKGKDDWVVGVAYLEIYEFADTSVAPTRYLTIAHIENGREKWRVRKKVPDKAIPYDPEDLSQGYRPYPPLEVRALGWGVWVVPNWTQLYLEDPETKPPVNTPPSPPAPVVPPYPDNSGAGGNYQAAVAEYRKQFAALCAWNGKGGEIHEESNQTGTLGSTLVVANKEARPYGNGTYLRKKLKRIESEGVPGQLKTEAVWNETYVRFNMVDSCIREGGPTQYKFHEEYDDQQWFTYTYLTPKQGDFYYRQNQIKTGKKYVPDSGDSAFIYQKYQAWALKIDQTFKATLFLLEEQTNKDGQRTIDPKTKREIYPYKIIRKYQFYPPRGGTLSPGFEAVIRDEDRLNYEKVLKLGNESYEPLNDMFPSINVNHIRPQPNWQAVDIYRRNPPLERVYENGTREENHSGTTITYINANLTAKKYAPAGIRNEAVMLPEDVIKKNGLYKAALYLITEIGQGPIEPFPIGVTVGTGGYGECVFTQGGAVALTPFDTKPPGSPAQAQILREFRVPSLFLLAILGECVVCTYTDWKELKKNRRTEKIYAGEKMFPNRLKNVPFEKDEAGRDIPKPAQYTFWNMSYNPL